MLGNSLGLINRRYLQPKGPGLFFPLWGMNPVIASRSVLWGGKRENVTAGLVSRASEIHIKGYSPSSPTGLTGKLGTHSMRKVFADRCGVN